MFEWRCAAAQLWLFETIFLDEIEQNQAILLKSYNVHHLILTYCWLNCCINLISHLQTPLIIFKSCHSLQFIAISLSSIIINEALHTAQRIFYVYPVYTLFVIMRGFVSLHNSAMNITPEFWAVSGFWLTLHSRNQHTVCLRYITQRCKNRQVEIFEAPLRTNTNMLIGLVALVLLNICW